MPSITSRHNPRIKEALRLRTRRGRDKQGRIIIDGVREVARALDGGVSLVEVFLAQQDEALPTEAAAVCQRIREANITLWETSPEVFERLAFGDRMDPLVAIAHTPASSLSDMRLPANPLVAVVEGVEKPGNLGAILRSADGAGVSAVIAADSITDLYNPNTIRASLGTVFTLPVASASSADTMAWLAQQQLHVFASWVDAEQPYHAADFTGGSAIVLGSEAHGLSDAWQHNVTRISLPMLGRADSLNVSATAAILFYEARRQRTVGE